MQRRGIALLSKGRPNMARLFSSTRSFLILFAAILLALLPAATTPAAAKKLLPVVFVHGHGDTAALWIAQIWRFESNGYPRELLYAVDLDHPAARDDNNVAQENRTSTTDVASQLAGFVGRVLIETGADKVVLVGNSRGCQTIRNYVQNGGGAANSALLFLAGCVHHGVGDFLSGLNAVNEVVPGLDTITTRSDKFDLFNQPMGDFIGFPGTPIGGYYEGPELRGATNIVLPGVDHRETAYSKAAFAEMFKAIAGHAPAMTDPVAEENPVLDGEVSGWAAGEATNLPLAGAKVSVYAVDAAGERMGDAVYTVTVGDDGRWGPFEAKSDQAYEFVVEAGGYPVHHIYRSAFPRSSHYVNLRPYPLDEAAEGKAAGIHMMRPRGYFGADDTVTFNGGPATGIDDNPVPHVWKVVQTFDSESDESVVGRFADGAIDESIAAKAWPTDGHVAWIELHY
jgi:pimeloyl-ACP methyl ester carboxylesterase